MSTNLKAHCRIMEVVRQGNPTEDIRRLRVFAWAVTALLICGSPLLSQWLTVITGVAKATSKMRRLLRWMNNPLVDVAAYYRPFIRRALADWVGKAILLIVDGTSPNGSWVVCRVSICFRGRAFPLSWRAFDTHSHSIPYKAYVKVLEVARDLLSPSCAITLVGDRGFGHRQLMKWCTAQGWHYLLRLKADSVVLLSDGTRRRLGSWRPSTGSLLHLADVRLLGEGGEKIGPLHIHMALAPEPATEPWYIASDRSDGCAVLADYRCRMRIEQSIRDDKSGGWNWEDSPLTQPVHSDRLGLIMATATLYTLTEGTLVADQGHRDELDPHDSRRLSYFQIGLRSFHRCLSHGRRLRLQLALDPRPDPDPVAPYGIPFQLFGRFTWIPASIPAGC